MHDAYGGVNLTASPYGVFMAGPSATGDIEGVIIHGAQGDAKYHDLADRRQRAIHDRGTDRAALT